MTVQHTPKRITVLGVLLCAGLILSACETAQKSPRPLANPRPSAPEAKLKPRPSSVHVAPKPEEAKSSSGVEDTPAPQPVIPALQPVTTVALRVSHPQLLQYLQAQLETLPNVRVVNGPAQAVLDVNIDTASATHEPRLIGLLTPQAQENELKFAYTLMATTPGVQPLHGEQTYPLPAQDVFTLAPSATSAQMLPPETLATFTEGLMPQFSRWLRVLPWQVQVTQVLNAEHVIIPLGEESGLFPGVQLYSSTQPRSTLSVVAFSANGAILKLDDGKLPNPGQILQPNP